MSNSPLVNYTKISPNSNNPRNHKIDKITIHHMAGNLTVEKCGDIFAAESRQASSNYAIGTDGRVALYVDEANRAWTSSSPENDHRAITIEVANDGGAPDWHVSDKALAVLIDLCVDICKRNDIEALNFTGDKTGNLTLHKFFAATACPGPYLESKMPYIVAEVNKRLAPEAEAEEVYIVKKDEKLGEIAAKYGTTYQELAEYNGIKNPNLIYPDQEIRIPGKKAPAPAPKTIAVGSIVRVKKGAKTYEGKNLAGFIYDRNHKVHQLNGDRAVITYSEIVVAAVNVKDLYLV